VLSADGSTLGEIDEVRPGFFQVLSTQGDSYWLPQSHIVEAGAGRVMLDLAAEDIGEYRRDDPGASHVVPATSTHAAYIEGATREEANELFDPETDADRRRF
jgi:hypothetical protein